MKPENSQFGFPFIERVRQDRFWWTKNANIRRMLASPPRAPSIDKLPIRFVLISCSKSKLTIAAPAATLYTGQLFKRAVSWAQRQNLTWFVVSALHGLLPPEQTIAPYNFTIKNLRGREREQWAHRVVSAELTRHVAKHSHAILILPEPYRRFIEPELSRNEITYENPLAGKGIGQQIKWLAEN
jgi:hypothetical protein